MLEVGPQGVRVALLAGGKGARLRPLTTVFPKPLMPLAEKPVVEILLRRLKADGFGEVTLCTGYLAELIMAVCGDGSRYGLRLSYVREETPLGTAGPLTLIDDLSDPFLVMNGDLLTTLSFARMLAHHRQAGADATLALFRRDVTIDFGVIESDQMGMFTRYVEKPTYHFEVSMGVYVMNRSVLRHLPAGQPTDMPALISAVNAAGGRVSCYREPCYWLDIGRLDDYALAQEQFTQNEALFLPESG